MSLEVAVALFTIKKSLTLRTILLQTFSRHGHHRGTLAPLYKGVRAALRDFNFSNMPILDHTLHGENVEFVIQGASIGFALNKSCLLSHGLNYSLLLLARQGLELLLHFVKMATFSAHPAELEHREVAEVGQEQKTCWNDPDERVHGCVLVGCSAQEHQQADVFDFIPQIFSLQVLERHVELADEVLADSKLIDVIANLGLVLNTKRV